MFPVLLYLILTGYVWLVCYPGYWPKYAVHIALEMNTC